MDETELAALLRRTIFLYEIQNIVIVFIYQKSYEPQLKVPIS